MSDLLATNLKGVLADLDDGGLTDDEALDQMRDILDRADEFITPARTEKPISGIAEEYLGRFGNKYTAATEMTKDLMRGDESTLKQGYTIGSALIAVAEQFNFNARDVAVVADHVVAETNAQGSVILVETNGADPETTTQVRGKGVAVISIDWDEVENGGRPEYIRDILDEIESEGIAEIKPRNHVGMPVVVRQLRERLAEMES